MFIPELQYQFHSLFKHNMRMAYGIRRTRVKGMQKDWRAKVIEERNNRHRNGKAKTIP